MKIFGTLSVITKVVHRLKAQLNEFLEPQAQAQGSGVFEPRLSRLRLRLNGFEPRLSLSSLKSLSKISLEYSVIQYLLHFSMLKITFGHFEQFLEIAIRL